MGKSNYDTYRVNISDGSRLVWDITFPYQDMNDIYVSVDGIDVDFDFVSEYQIKLKEPAPKNSKIKIYRSTEYAKRKVDWKNGAILTETDLNLQNEQLLFVVQETLDAVERCLNIPESETEYNAQGKRIRNIGDAVEPNDAMTMNHYETNIKPYVEKAILAEAVATAKANTATLMANVASQKASEANEYANRANEDQIRVESILADVSGAIFDTRLQGFNPSNHRHKVFIGNLNALNYNARLQIDAENVTNKPVFTGTGFIAVKVSDDGLCIVQELITGETKQYTRSCINGVWSSWVLSPLLGDDGKIDSSMIKKPFFTGMIMMFSGDEADIPSDWHICDGTSGTPDLRNRFVVGAGGTYANGSTGGSKNITPTGTVQNTTLTQAQMPTHTHVVKGMSDGDMGYGGSWYVTPHSHVGGGTVDIATQSAGSSGSHAHGLAMNSIDVTPLYYAMAYIMYVGE